MQQFSPPYPVIRDGLRRGLVIPFLGAGASLRGRTPDAPHGSDRAAHLPTTSVLTRYLARKTRFPSNEPLDLTKVAQYYDVVNGRQALHRELHSVFQREPPLSALHSYLATIPGPLLIATTNYDDLVERAFDAVGRPYDRVVHTTDQAIGDHLLWWPHGAAEPRAVKPNKLFIDLENVTVIYKMHGGLDRHKPTRDQYVITEDDYIDFLARMTKNKAVPAIFAEPFQTRHFLFLGYSLCDWNLRVVLNRIEKDLRRSRNIRSWAIQYGIKPLERRFWQERGVEVYDKLIDAFVNELAGR